MRFRLLPALLTVAMMALSARASASEPLDAATRAALVAEAARALRDDYAFPAVGERAAAALAANAAAGAYDSLANPQALARRLTDDLQAATHDRHLRVMLAGDPTFGGLLPAPPRAEGGIVRADRLSGNVGYIEIASFPTLDLFTPALDRAMGRLAGSRALIVDLRRNGGGEPASVDYLVSVFLRRGLRTHVNDLVRREPGATSYKTDSFWSVPTDVRFGRRPVYVLTSRATFSGGEELAYDLQAFRRAIIVGEVTSGGANPGGFLPLAGGLAIYMPNGYARNPVTHTNWEGVGVKPDVSVPAPDALKAALARLGEPAITGEVDALSRARVFAPRTAALPGSRAALTAILADLADGAPRYDRMKPGAAEATRSHLAWLIGLLKGMGPARDATFIDVDPSGLDTYDVTFPKAVQRWAILLASDGKTAWVGPIGPPAPRRP